MRTKSRKFTTFIVVSALALALALTSWIGMFASSVSVEAVPPATTFIEPVDNSAELKANDGHCRVWFKTTTGEEATWADMPGGASGWGMQTAPLVSDNVLINGKTFAEINSTWNNGTQIGGKNALERFYLEYLSGTKIAFGFHMDQNGTGAFSIKDVKTVEIKKGFNWCKSDKTAIDGMKTNEKFLLEPFKRGDNYFFGRQLKQKTEGTGIATDAATLGGTTFKTAYEQGEELDLTGVTIDAKYQDGGTRTVAVQPHMVTGYNKNTTGPQTLTIAYNGASFTKEVTVTARPIQKIELLAGEYKTAYKYAEPIDVKNMNLKVTYTDTTVLESTPVTRDMISGYDNTKIGKQTVTITYGATPKTTTYDITLTDITEINELTPVLDMEFEYGEGVNISLQPSTTTDGVKNLWGVQNCPMVADKVLINGMTFHELNATVNGGVPIEGKYPLERIKTCVQNGIPTLTLHMDQRNKIGGFKASDIKTITILAGLNMCTYTDDFQANDTKGGEYTAISGVVTRKDYHIANYQNKLVKGLKQNEAGTGLATDAITVKTPAKSSYVKGEIFDYKSMRLTCKYFDGTTAVVTPNVTDISGFDSMVSGEQTITISHNGGSVTQVVTVQAVDITSIAVSGDYKTAYDYFDDFSIEGMILTLNYAGGSTLGEMKLDMISGYTKGKLGTQTITVTFLGSTTTFDIVVTDAGKSANISFSGYTPFDETYGSLVLAFGFTDNVKADLKAIWNIDKGANTADKIKINGVLVSELITQKKVARLCAYGSTLIFHMDEDLVVSQEMYDYKCIKQDGYKAKYPTFESVTLVETVEILEGFQYYTASQDYWGSDPGEDLSAVPGGVIRKSVTLKNDAGYRYIRPFKLDGEAIASDALTIATSPKLVYELDEQFDTTGMTLLAKYADGGEETIVVADSWIKGFDPTKAGKQNVTVRFNDHEVSFEVTVKDKPAPKSGCGSGCGASISASIGVLTLALGAGLMLIKRGKKD